MARFSWVFGVLGVLFLLTAAALFFLFKAFVTSVIVALVTGAVLLFVYAFADRDALSETVQSRPFLQGSGSSLLIVMFGGAVVFAYMIAESHDKTVDLTTNKEFSLSSHTIGVLNGLEEEVEVLAFFKAGTPAEEKFSDLIGRMEEHTDKLKVLFSDPLREPFLAQAHGINSDRTVLFIATGDRERRMEHSFDEKEITTHLIQLFAEADYRICWSQGHGEPNPDDTESKRGVGGVIAKLESLNYQVTPSFLMTEGIDSECEALVVFRPIIEWFPYEREALAAYLAQGGRVFIALEPGLVPELALELERYGIDVGEDIVVDINPENMLMGVDDPGFVVLRDDDFLYHPITKPLHAAVVLGIAQSITPTHATEGIELSILLESGTEAWAEKDIDNPEVSPDTDEKIGDVPLMVAATISDPSVLDVASPEQPNAEASIGERIQAVLIVEFPDAEEINLEARLREDLGAGDAHILGIGAGMDE
ncbi:MAG: hypothetical protein HN348_18300, partial [Proteobacteria bacterium]|nr:hypothetical protein [Pseudomonadota bacterium]